MKHIVRFALSCLASAGLLFGAAAYATDVSKRPLKVDINVKPNVIFGMDDSGSMDWEILLTAYNGILNWDTTNYTYWSGGKFLTKGSYYMSYLFPVGTGTGGAQYADSNSLGKAVPPSPQFAALRSSSYNPLYYNPSVTYAPWAAAYHDGATQTYGDATPTAAKSHPALSGSLTMNLTANQTADFYYRPGMRKPDDKLATSSSWISTTYYPATYWVVDAGCTAVDSWSSSCIKAPDGTKLRKIEIKSGNTFPSGRSYANELQNFANWWSYYRKRKLMLAGAMGTVLDDLTGMRLGVVGFNRLNDVTMYDADAADSASNRRRVAGAFYTNAADGGTPTSATLNHIGKQYMTNNNVIQYSCQRNNVFLVTDGFANDTYTPPAYDAAKFGSGFPYQTTTASSIADGALAYFTLNLRNGRTTSGAGKPLSDGRVPLTNQNVKNPDTNTNLHMNTYAITLGARGTIWPGITDPFANTFSWPAPVAETATSIDDIWHATINGRGQMYVADNPQQAAINIRNGLTDMINQTGAQSAIAVSTLNLARGDQRAYLGSYTTGSWGGDITANMLNTSTGAVTDVIWSASAQLAARTEARVISSYKAAFTEAAVGAQVSATSTGRAALFNYLRGGRTGEGSTYRARTSVIGAVTGAKPLVSASDKVVYAATGEGMLHAFDTETGKELWAYVPGLVLGGMAQTAARNYYFETLLDGTPSLASLSSSQRILVAGRGAAGAGYYALDVSNPREALNEDSRGKKALWEIGHGGSFTLGQSVGRPLVVKTKTYGWVVLLTQGYNGSNDARGRLYVVDALTGALRTTLTVADGSSGDLGLAQISAASEADGTVAHVYGGDLLGNLWHFDLDKGTAVRMAKFTLGGQAQPITTAPEIVMIKKQRVVLVGTGKLLGASDFNATSTQSFYAVKDDGVEIASDKTRSTLLVRTITTEGSKQTLTGADLDWAKHKGWYFDLPNALQVTADPTVAYGAVAFTGNKTNTADCWAASSLFAFDFSTGKNVGKSEWAMVTLSERDISSQALIFNTDKGSESDDGDDGEPKKDKDCINTHLGNNATNCQEFEPDSGIASRRNAWRQVRQGDR
ncbi:PilC/PilY family type IV pilus protein [Aquincola sp. MAHUQ-54]|uniref:PilC/PilY family type IV pilus protein n=1 Tax=Aquincola agrisoli TaxID=3119538 RepID=A0AAW9Q8U3_9BURK